MKVSQLPTPMNTLGGLSKKCKESYNGLRKSNITITKV